LSGAATTLWVADKAACSKHTRHFFIAWNCHVLNAAADLCLTLDACCSWNAFDAAAATAKAWSTRLEASSELQAAKHRFARAATAIWDFGVQCVGAADACTQNSEVFLVD